MPIVFVMQGKCLFSDISSPVIVVFPDHTHLLFFNDLCLVLFKSHVVVKVLLSTGLNTIFSFNRIPTEPKGLVLFKSLVVVKVLLSTGLNTIFSFNRTTH